MRIRLVILVMVWSVLQARAQLYVNGALTIQNGAVLYADDTVVIDALASVQLSGILHVSRDVRALGSYINTANGGFLVTPVNAGVTQLIPIGAGSNNSIKLSHQNGNRVFYKVSVRNGAFVNPETMANAQSTEAVNLTWMIQPQLPVIGQVISTGWNGVNELVGFNRSQCNVASWKQGVSLAWSPSVYASAALNVTQPAYFATSNMAGLDSGIWYYYGVGSGSALPVLFKTVGVKSFGDNRYRLHWQVAQLRNSKQFDVEHLSISKEWETIGTVQTPLNMAVDQYFEFWHTPNDQQLVHYYRIKQMDVDGSTRYSVVVNTSVTPNMELTLFPNPTNGKVTIAEALGVMAEVKLYTTMGVEVFSEPNYKNGQLLDLSVLPKGMYLVHYQSASSKKVFTLLLQ